MLLKKSQVRKAKTVMCVLPGQTGAESHPFRELLHSITCSPLSWCSQDIGNNGAYEASDMSSMASQKGIYSSLVFIFISE